MSTAIKLITAAELWEMPEDSFRYELVKGELRKMSPAGSEHGALIVNLTAPLKVHTKANKLGVVFGAETGFQLTDDPDSVRAPDIAFVRRERIPPTGLPKGYWRGAPDVAVEVISPNDRKYEVDEKIEEYLAAGSRLVQVLYPKKQTATVHRPNGSLQVLTINDVLDGEDVIPGFQCPVTDIFEQD